MKTTLVIGASLNEDKPSNEALRLLQENHIPALGLGREGGSVGEVTVETEKRNFPAGDIHTVSIYLRAANQAEFADWILSLKPARVFFNPGAENEELAARFSEAGIECRKECMITCINKNEF